jgi:sulfur carrier protein
MIKITLNGEEKAIEEGINLSDLLDLNGISVSKVAVAVDMDIVPRSQYGLFELKEGMSVEVVNFVGGG